MPTYNFFEREKKNSFFSIKAKAILIYNKPRVKLDIDI
jgi:hypothetical protein